MQKVFTESEEDASGMNVEIKMIISHSRKSKYLNLKYFSLIKFNSKSVNLKNLYGRPSGVEKRKKTEERNPQNCVQIDISSKKLKSTNLIG